LIVALLDPALLKELIAQAAALALGPGAKLKELLRQ